MGSGTSGGSGVNEDVAVAGFVADTLADAPRECVTVAVCDKRDRDTVKKVGVADGDRDTERLVDALAVADDDTVYGDTDGVFDADALTDGVGLAVRVAEPLGLTVRVTEPLNVVVVLALADGEPLREGLRVADGEMLGEFDAVAVAETDRESVKGDAETETDGLPDEDCETEPETDGLVDGVAALVGDFVTVAVSVGADEL